jgi:Zn-dependent M28 family amino/carboxypeptidase
MLLEVARGLADAPEPPRRGVLFVAFDLEEAGLVGSRHFVAQPPVPLEQIRLFLTADLIGGALGGVCREQVFVIGAEHAAPLRPWLREASAGLPLKVADVGSDLLVINRSDYGPFRSRKIPYLFFSTGENPRYHTPNDRPETLDYPKLQAISRLIAGVVQRAAQAPELPAWSDTPAHTLDEAIALRDVLQTLIENRDALQIRGVQETLVSGTLEQLRQIVARGVQTPEERARILRSAQIILMTVL